MRKTAAVSVAKLHDINASLVEEQVQFQYMWICFPTNICFQGFLDSLRELLGDSNPMVDLFRNH